MTDGFFHWITHEGAALVPAIMGAVAMNAFNYEGLTPFVRKMIVGTLSGAYLAPLAVDLANAGLSTLDAGPLSPSGDGGITFLIGAFGMVLFETGLRLFRSYNLEKIDE